MPVREEPQTAPAAAPAVHHKETDTVLTELVNIDFLPEAIRRKIAETFDFYFNLGGFRARTQTVADGDAPDFPNQLSSLDSGEIGNLLAKATAWAAFVNEKLRYVSVAVNVVAGEAEEAFDRALVTVARESSGRGGLTEAERKSKAKLDEGYLGMLYYRNKLDGVKSMLDNLSKTYDRNITSLSREVTRRERTLGIVM